LAIDSSHFTVKINAKFAVVCISTLKLTVPINEIGCVREMSLY